MFLSAEQIRFNKSCTEASLGYASAMTAASGVVGNQIFSFWLDVMSPTTSAASSRSSRGKNSSPRAWGESRIVTASESRAARAARRRRVGTGLRVGASAGDNAFVEAMADWFSIPGQDARMMSGGMPPNLFGGAGLPFAGSGGQMAGMAFPFSAGSFNTGAAMPGAIDPAAVMSAWMNMDWTRSPASWPMAMGMMSLGVPKTVACPMAEANLAMMDALNTANEMSRRSYSALGISMPGPVVPDFSVPSFSGLGFSGPGFPGQGFPGVRPASKPARKPVGGMDLFNGMGGTALNDDAIAQVQAFQRALFGL